MKLYALLDRVFDALPKTVFRRCYRHAMEHRHLFGAFARYFSDREMRDSIEAFGQPDYDVLNAFYETFAEIA